MKKKLLSLLMACAMILALAVPAFAAGDAYFDYDSESDQLTQPIEFQARMFVPTVKLSLPKITENPVVLNPYKIAYDGTTVTANTLNGKAVTNSTDQTKQVISPVYKIQNATDVKLNYSVVATATTEGKLALANSQIAANDTGNKAYVAVVFRKVGVLAANAVANDNSVEQTLDGSDKANFETIVLKTTGEAKTDNTQPKYLNPATTDAPNFLEFQFQGSLSRLSTNPWTDDDKLTVNMTFTFTPESGVDVNNGTFEISTYPAAKSTDLTKLAKAIDTTSLTQVTNAGTDPQWVIVSAGAYGAKIEKATSGTPAVTTYSLALDKAKVDAAIDDGKPAGGAYAANDVLGMPTSPATSDMVILGYMDNKGFPRTVKVALNVKLA